MSAIMSEKCRQEDAAGWVAWQKRKWRAAAARRKRKKLDAPVGPGTAVPAGPRGEILHRLFRVRGEFMLGSGCGGG